MVLLHGSQGLLVSFPTTRGEHRAESFQMHVDLSLLRSSKILQSRIFKICSLKVTGNTQ